MSVLEGGYALEGGRNSAFRRSISAHLKALVQDDDDYEDEEPSYLLLDDLRYHFILILLCYFMCLLKMTVEQKL